MYLSNLSENTRSGLLGSPIREMKKQVFGIRLSSGYTPARLIATYNGTLGPTPALPSSLANRSGGFRILGCASRLRVRARSPRAVTLQKIVWLLPFTPRESPSFEIRAE